MPIHDWSRVDSGTYHNFHFRWLAEIMDRLNGGILPSGFFAMAEQRSEGPIADVLTLSEFDADLTSFGGAAVATQPSCQVVEQAERTLYRKKARRLAIRHERGQVIAFLELISPGNKDTKRAFNNFTSKAALLIERGTHLSVIDPFRPGRFDKNGIHRSIWDKITSQSRFVPNPAKPLLAVSYDASELPKAYVNSFGFHDLLPDLAVFLASDVHVLIPLEQAYQTAWNLMPEPIRRAVTDDPVNTR